MFISLIFKIEVKNEEFKMFFSNYFVFTSACKCRCCPERKMEFFFDVVGGRGSY